MARGPLPSKNKRRRNAPTIPTTDLPPTGRKGRPPAVPQAYNLGKAGRDWWKWAWSSPQAAAWDKGALYFVARRAQLEDDLDALGEADRFELAHYLDVSEEDQDVARRIEFVFSRICSLAGDEIKIMKEMRELENRLGLNPKAMSDLRWEIVSDQEKAAAAEADKAASTAKGSSGSKKKPMTPAEERKLRLVKPA